MRVGVRRGGGATLLFVSAGGDRRVVHSPLRRQRQMCIKRQAMCSATTARGKVGSLRSQDVPWIDAGSARGALCGCCNPAPGRAALLPCHFSAALQHRLFKLKIWSAA